MNSRAVEECMISEKMKYHNLRTYQKQGVDEPINTQERGVGRKG